MPVLERVAWFLEQTAGTALFFWPVSGTLVAGLLVSLIVRTDWRHRAFIDVFVCLAGVSAVSVGLLLVVATLFTRPSAQTFPPAAAWPSLLVVAVLLAALAASVVLLVRATGAQLQLAAVAALGLWLVTCAAFVTFFEVSGVASL